MKLTPAQYVTEIFGGQSELAETLGVTRQVVYRWTNTQSSTRGLIPSKYQARVLKIAEERGYDLTPRDVILGRELDDVTRMSLVNQIAERIAVKRGL